MSNLVGRGPEQLPTTSMLGGLAFQDPENVRIVNLNATGSASFSKTTAPIASIDGTSIALSIVTISSGTTSYTILPSDKTVILKNTVVCNVVLPSAASSRGRELEFVVHAAGGANATVSTVRPLNGGTVGVQIVVGSTGRFARLQSDGTDWLIISAN